MPPILLIARRPVVLLRLVALVVVAFAAHDALPQVSRAAAASHHATMNMSDASMKATSTAWWATHPRTGLHSTQSASAIFSVENYVFDSDGNTATKVDTARIAVGETVQWNWVNGFHTVTSGVDGNDPNAGVLFDQPIDSSDPTYSHTFSSPGTFDFFCAYHWPVGMKGVVIVSAATPTRGTTWGGVKSLYRP